MIEDLYVNITLIKITFDKDSTGAEVIVEADPVIFQGVVNQHGSKAVEKARRRGLDVDYVCYCEVTELTKSIGKNDLVNGLKVVYSPKNTFNLNHHIKLLLKDSD